MRNDEDSCFLLRFASPNNYCLQIPYRVCSTNRYRSTSTGTVPGTQLPDGTGSTSLFSVLLYQTIRVVEVATSY